MVNIGWVKLYRKIRESWIWQNEQYLRAWLDLLLMANVAEKKWLYNNNLITVRRGEVITTLRTLAKRWDWSVGKVRHFIELLKNDTMISTQKAHGFTHLSINNYETYQSQQHTESIKNDTREAYPKHTESTSEAHTKEYIKNEKEGEEVTAPAREETTPFADSSLNLLKEKYPKIDVDLSLQRYLDHRQNKRLQPTLKSFELWLKTDEQQKWNQKQPESEKKISLYCPGCGKKQEVPLKGGFVPAVFCCEGEFQMVEKFELPYFKC